MSTYGGSNRQVNGDLRSSIAWRLFYRANKETRDKYLSGGNPQVITAITQFADKRLPNMMLNGKETVLSPKWTPLYQMGDVGKEIYAKKFQECRETVL